VLLRLARLDRQILILSFITRFPICNQVKGTKLSLTLLQPALPFAFLYHAYGKAFLCVEAAYCHALCDLENCAGLETSVTRTPLASTLILSILAGSSTILVPCLASALVALYITLDFPFIMSQRDRSDMALKVSLMFFSKTWLLCYALTLSPCIWYSAWYPLCWLCTMH